MDQPLPFVEMRGISKYFPGVVANDNVDLTIHRGEIHALLGENGAGKSTLMNILYGLYQPDAGEILLNGKPVQIDGPNTAINYGIGMVHQHFMLVEPFTVAENIVLGCEPRRGVWFSRRQAIAQVEAISKQYNLQVDPRARIADISVGMQQRVEILKALYRGADLLILDEPTAVLTPQEADELMQIMRQLTDAGKSVIFISHKLKEVLRSCDKVTIIRRGRKVVTMPTAGASMQELASLMVGRSVQLTVNSNPSQPGQSVLQVENLSANDARGLPALRNVSFDVREGEIVAIAGVEGNGQTELVDCLAGMRPATSGTIRLRGQTITNQNPRAVVEAGVAHIPQDRHKHGLVLDFTVAENAILRNYYQPPVASGIFVKQDEMVDYATKLVEKYDVRTPSVQTLARSLSGGNQQKIVVAREIEQQPDLLIAAQPTRGLDVGAIEFIHKQLIEQRNAGKAVLLVSLELDEILALADRILVFYEGRIAGELSRDEATEENIGLLMVGGTGKGGDGVAS
ncbi:MAG: ABC transporter ATP-binding protein [Firmicutes bacterium]|nr:ABC transporter ATP-binding protein [Bacillota bacterium]